ncbi:MAG: HAMP domain-containing sensor histidine kinase [Gemmatimonadaceae bacterium]
MADRLPRSRSTILVAVLLLTMALAAALAYEAWRAARSHRATAERALRDYASFAAWEFTASSKGKMYSSILYLFNPVMHEQPLRPGERLEDPGAILRPTAREKLCPSATPFAFRLDPSTGVLVFAGSAPSPERQRQIREAVKADLPEYVRDFGYRTITRDSGVAPLSLVYQVKWGPHDTVAAVYGVEFCVGSLAASVFHTVMESGTVLPPALTRGLPNDSLFSVLVWDFAGHPLYRSPHQYPATYTGEHALDAYGGLHTTISINPAVADRLVIGGRPKSRLTLLGALLGLTGVLVAIGLLQLRREHELARLRSDFVASVSHELRTPLAQVRMFAETLRLGRVRSESERARSLEIIDQEARRLTHLVENILQFSRAERQAVRLSLRSCALAPQLREALDSFAPLAAPRRVRVQQSLDERACAIVDLEAFRQIVLNLVDNAIKYSPEGGQVRVLLRTTGEWVRLEVEDEGPGIPAGDRERIWAPFFRLERDVSSAVAGSGIGLAVVRDLVARHGGRTGVDTRHAPARGSTFYVALPRADDVSGGDADQSARAREEADERERATAGAEERT